MKKVVDLKTGRKITIFNQYKLDRQTSCPECGRPFDENDLSIFNECGKRNCKKCGAKLIK